MQPRFGIRTKLLLSILAILLVSYATLLYSTLNTLNDSLRTEIGQNLKANLNFARSQYLDGADIVKYSLSQASLSHSLHRLMRERDEAPLRERLERWHTLLPFVDMMAVLDTNKMFLARLHGPANGERLTLPGVADQALAAKRVVVSTELIPIRFLSRCGVEGYSRDQKGDAMVVTVAVPVVGADGKVVGCILTGEILNRYRTLPARFTGVFGGDVEVAITQQGMKIVGSGSLNPSGSARFSHRIVDTLERGEVYRGQSAVGSRRYEVAIDPLTNSRGELVGSLSVGVPTENFHKIRMQNLRNIFTSAFVGILCSFALAFVASRQLTGPLRQLATGVRRIQEGDLNQRVEDGYDDEVGRLASAFNSMVEALQQRDRIIGKKTADLEELNGQLEKKVAERTRALRMEMGRLEAVLTSMVEGVVVTDANDRVVLFNPAAQQIFELVPHRVLEQPIESVAQAGGFSVLLPRLRELAGSGGGSASQETVDVKGKRVKVNVAALAEEEGSFAGSVLSFRDVTVEEQVDRMKTEFISTVSHELKTPLTSINGSLQLLLNRGKWLTETERQLLAVCYRNTQRLIRLIGEILDISGIESGGISFNFKPISIGELTVYAVEEINGYAMGRGITVVNSIPQRLPLVYGDSDRLMQVMTNLLSNAVKFSPEGKVVMVTARQEGNYVAVSVSDRGEAIQWSDRDKLFKKFQQLEGSDGKVGGSGLGLAICKEIVERHHGRIFYDAGREAGNTFCFTIPVIGEGDGKG